MISDLKAAIKLSRPEGDAETHGPLQPPERIHILWAWLASGSRQSAWHSSADLGQKRATLSPATCTIMDVARRHGM